MSKHIWLFHGTYAQRTETNPVRIKKHFHLIVLIWMTTLHAHAELRNTIWKVKHPTHYPQLACARAAFLMHFKKMVSWNITHSSCMKLCPFHCFYWSTETLLVCPGSVREMQRQLWTCIYAIIEIKMRVIGAMNLRGPQCRCLHVSLILFLWWLYSHKTETDTFVYFWKMRIVSWNWVFVSAKTTKPVRWRHFHESNECHPSGSKLYLTMGIKCTS